MPLIRSERRTPCRCSKCRARRTLAKPPDAYKREPKCHVPGCEGLMRPDLFRIRANKDKSLRKKDRGELCTCNAYHYPHAKGEGSCVHREETIIERSLRGTRISDHDTSSDLVPF